jgi:photosynthetic reaction center cytochrome c subunit
MKLGTAIGGICVVLGVSLAHGQTAPQDRPLMAEEVFKNVQVLKGIPVDQFMDTMGFFSAALGYNCTNCHGEGVLGNWDKYADDVPIKRTARRMIQMVNALNQSEFGGQRTVTCYSCHRGAGAPKAVPSLMEQYGEPPPDDPNEVERLPRAPAASPTAEEILKRYMQALGGEQRLRTVGSFIGKGTYEGFDSYHGKVAFEVLAKAPGQRAVIVHTPNGDSATVYNGRTGWVTGVDRPIPVMQLAPGGDLDGARLDAVLAFPAGLQEALTQWRAGFAAASIDSRDVQVIQGTAGGSRVKFFFDKQSGLLARVVRYNSTIVGMVPTQIDYSDYREVAGIQMPFQWRVTWTDGQSTFQLSEVEPNVAIEDARFATPQVAAQGKR